MGTVRHIASALCILGLLGTSAVASAQSQGFQLNRYEPTPAGEWSFWVDHPWYSSTRYFAAGVTLNYGHTPLVFGVTRPDGSFTVTDWIITHQFIGHLDLAGSFLDRVNLNASLPITFLESGTRSPWGNVAPMNGVGVGDPRFGVSVRIIGQPDRSPISLSIAGQIWVPLRKFSSTLAPTENDQEVRVLPKLILAGYGSHIRWSFTGGFLYRPQAHLGIIGPEGSTAGSEIQLGAAISYADQERRFAIGPEAAFATLVIPNNAGQPDATSLELLLGAHYNIASQVQLGLAGGVGLLRQPGTPDFRALFRVAYAPIKKLAVDRDKDGILDKEDACPDEPGVRTDQASTNGCPPRDRDRDGIVDAEDLCPDTPQGEHPDPQKRGCPAADKDADGVFDLEDLCPDMPQGEHPDPQRKGCPAADKDGDGVFDFEDQCLDIPQGAHPNPEKKGCPDGDKDSDAAYDHEDLCPEVPAGHKPDPKKKGCPLPDRDNDTVVDLEDACPDQPGAPSSDPQKNGCPALITIRDGKLNILQAVFFATNKDTILKKSFPLLQSVADALKVSVQIKKVRIEGHSDDRGKRDYNIALSDRRAKSVMQFLIQHGIAPERLEAQGIGPDQPIADNKTAKGRATNRRVDFVIIDPPQPKSATAAPPVTAAPEVIDQDPDKKHKHHHRNKKSAGDSAQATSGAALGDKPVSAAASDKEPPAASGPSAPSPATAGGKADPSGKRHHHRHKAQQTE